MTLFLLFFLLLPILLSTKIRTLFFRHSPKTPPGPPGLPLLGNLLQFDTTAPHKYLCKLSAKYGPLMSLKLGSLHVLVISSANIAKEALKTNDLTFSSRPSTVGTRKLSYNGLDVAFTPYGEYWKEMRKICNIHLFSLKRVQSFQWVREEEVHSMIQTLSERASDTNSRGVITDLSSMTMSLTSNLICRVAFSKDCDELDGEEEERGKFLKLLNETQGILATFFVSDFFPGLGWIDKIFGMTSKMDEIFLKWDCFYQRLIEDHFSPNRDKALQKDILDILLELMKDENNSNSTIDFSFDHIKAILMNIFLAGTDTSAAAIVWAMTALMKKPTEMARVQAEIRELMKPENSPTPFVNEDHIQKLPFLKAIVKETLRLYPPSPLLVPRATTTGCTVAGYDVRPNSFVYINSWAIGRDPEWWKDPHEFMPERFMKDNSVDFKGQHFELIPFGAGRRICPGLSMGVFTVELVLANLLYAFDWELPCGMKVEDIDIDVLPGVTMHKKTPLCLVARCYKK